MKIPDREDEYPTVVSAFAPYGLRRIALLAPTTRAFVIVDTRLALLRQRRSQGTTAEVSLSHR